MKLLLFLLATLLLVVNSDAQLVTFEQYKDAADTSFLKYRDYHNSFSFYSKALAFNPEDSIELISRAASSAYHSWELNEAQQLYERLVRYNDQLEGKNMIMPYYFLGLVYLRKGDYRKARKEFEQFVEQDSLNIPLSEVHREAKHYISICKWALDSTNIDTTVFEPLSNINKCDRHQMAILPLDNELVYTEFQHSDVCSDQFIHQIGTIRSSSTNSALDLHLLNQNRGDTTIGFLSLTPDRKYLYYSVCLNINTIDTYCKIVRRSFDPVNGNFGTEENVIGDLTNTSETFTHSNVGWDSITKNTFLYFASNKKGTIGGMDIWKGQVNSSSAHLSNIQNLNTINSPTDEISPFYDIPTGTLYFSSDRVDDEMGFGGFDIYRSVNVDPVQEIFSFPEILPGTVNSATHETFYVRSGEIFWFTSNRIDPQKPCSDGHACCYNIFEGEVIDQSEPPCEGCCPSFKPIVLDYCGKLGYRGFNVDVKMEFWSMELRDINGITQWVRKDSISLDSTGLNYDVSPNGKYRLYASKPGYQSDSLDVKVDSVQCNIFSCPLYLQPLKLEMLLLVRDQCTEKENYIPIEECTITVMQDGKELPGLLCSANSKSYELIPWKNSVIEVAHPRYETMKINNFIGIPVKNKCDTIHVIELIGKPWIFDSEPINLFFDNDIPAPHSVTAATSLQTYSETWENGEENQFCDNENCTDRHTGYGSIARRDFYIQSSNPFVDSLTIIQFFADAHKGKQNYDFFKSELKRWICSHPEGSLILDIEGHASPKYNSNYNYNLSLRRIHSVELDLRMDSLINLAFEEERLVISNKEAKGELEGRINNVNADQDQVAASIFHPSAALSRRVTIKIRHPI